MVDLFTPHDVAEAEAVAQLLVDHGIPARVVRLESSLYPGMFSSRGWGTVRVPAEQLAEARALLDEWRSAAPISPEASSADPVLTPSVRDVHTTRAGVPWKTLLLVLSLAANAYFAWRYFSKPPANQSIRQRPRSAIGTDAGRRSA